MEEKPTSSSFDDIDDMEGTGLTTNQKTSTKVHQDPIADKLLSVYSALNLDDNEILKFVIIVSPVGLIIFFYMFVSSSTSFLISFSAFVISIVFLGVSGIMLCEILKKDIGPRAMQDIAEVIREGSEGFFVTQYGTIFKYAFLTQIAIFIMYAMRELPQNSKLNDFFTPLSMAFITSISFGIGAVCSAISGYAGIWVSVRANLRVAAASKRCYNDAI